MTTIDDIYGGKYMKASDLQKPVKLTIKAARVEQFPGRAEGEVKDKVVLVFNDIEKELVVNATNAARISEIANTKVIEDWAGTTIMLVKDKTKYAGNIVDTIAVMAPV